MYSVPVIVAVLLCRHVASNFASAAYNSEADVVDGEASWEPVADLPPGWEEFFDDNYELPYYYHAETETTTWKHPGAESAYEDSLDETYSTLEEVHELEPAPKEERRRKRKRKRKRKRRCLSQSCLAKTLPELSDVYVSDQAGSSSFQCGTKDQPCKTIQAGIDRASSGGNVHIFEGHYFGEGNVKIRVGSKDVMLRAALPHIKPVIDCQMKFPLMSNKVSTGSVRFHGFIIHDCDLLDKNGNKMPLGDVDVADVISPNQALPQAAQAAGRQSPVHQVAEPQREPTLLERWFRL